MRFAGWALCLAVLVPAPLDAQWTLTPGPHFGALSVPAPDTATYLGLSLDRFTPHGKVTEPGTYNAITRTTAFNFLTYSEARWLEREATLGRATLQVGWGHDEPTRWIQSSLHTLADLPQVPSPRSRDHVMDVALILELTRWSRGDAGRRRFVGGGVAVGTPHTEAWIQAGRRWQVGPGWPVAAGMVRLGFPVLGGAFPRESIADGYLAAEATLDLPLAEWLDADWLPTPFVGIRQDTGFFLDVTGRRIPERHGSFGLTGADGTWRFEVWNEYFGGLPKDIGPTGGGRLAFRIGH